MTLSAKLSELAHAKHLALGIRSANCPHCRPLPEWVRRAQEARLPVKVWAK